MSNLLGEILSAEKHHQRGGVILPITSSPHENVYEIVMKNFMEINLVGYVQNSLYRDGGSYN